MEDEFKIRTTIPPEHVELLKMKNLTQIANINTCDKGTEWYEKHGYTEVYCRYVPEIGKIDMLEIGIWHGDSMRMWKDWNDSLYIDAIDINKSVLGYIKPDERSNIHIGNVTDKVFVNQALGDKKYDVIIDDGSHKMMEIMTAIRILWDRLKKGGVYFIEDLHATHARRLELMADLIKLFATKDMGLADARMFCDGKLLLLEKK